jgi:hypothetical protein
MKAGAVEAPADYQWVGNFQMYDSARVELA